MFSRHKLGHFDLSFVRKATMNHKHSFRFQTAYNTAAVLIKWGRFDQIIVTKGAQKCLQFVEFS